MFIKTKILILFIAIHCFENINAQSKINNDSLFILGYKYSLGIPHNYRTFIPEFPMNVFTAQYNGAYRQITYKSIEIIDCAENRNIDPNTGNEEIEKVCIGEKVIENYLSNFKDTLALNLDQLNLKDINVKRLSKKIQVSVFRLRAIYDSTIVEIVFDKNYNYEYYTKKYIDSDNNRLNKGNFRFMILDNLFYLDEKKQQAYYLPYNFILVSNH